MYARVGRSSDATGAAEVCTLRRLAGADELVLSLWPTRAAAGADPTAEWYEVEADEPGGSPDEQPAIAVLLWFDGPVSDPQHTAMTRAGDERIAPRMADHPGSVRWLSLWQPERRRILVIGLATSVESIEDARRVVDSMELLPGEDPALLPPGPDRIDLYRVRSAVAAR